MTAAGGNHNERGRGGGQSPGVVVTIDLIGAAVAKKGVVAVAAHDGVVSSTALDRIVSRAAHEEIIPRQVAVAADNIELERSAFLVRTVANTPRFSIEGKTRIGADDVVARSSVDREVLDIHRAKLANSCSNSPLLVRNMN